MSRAQSDLQKAQSSAYKHPLALAYESQELLDAGVFNIQAEIARRRGLSRARVTQVMKLLSLPSEIQTYIAAPPVEKQRLCSGRRLGWIVAVPNGKGQAKAFACLLKRLSRKAGH